MTGMGEVHTWLRMLFETLSQARMLTAEKTALGNVDFLNRIYKQPAIPLTAVRQDDIL
jgi:hypothetical protein